MGFTMIRSIFKRLRAYWTMTKSLQTGLLLATGLAGFFSATHAYSPSVLAMLIFSLYCAISGSTIMNMWFDRDIDSQMRRTSFRPLPTDIVTPTEALVVGSLISAIGIGSALMLSAAYGVAVFAGWAINLLVYTIWLKRRTCWAIIFGGISGGMPVIAGRLLGSGSIDWISLLMAGGILFWIPTHIMTFSIRYANDYKTAGIPTFPQAYGVRATRVIIALSSILSSACILLAALMIGLQEGYIRLLTVLSVGLLTLAIRLVYKPSDYANMGLFKYASLYMLSAMALLAL